VLDPYFELLRPTESTAYLIPLDDTFGSYRTQNAGRTWTRSALPTGCGQPWHFAATGATNLWAVCNGAPAESVRVNSVYSSIDGGGQWTLVARIPWAALSPLPPGTFPHPDHGLAAGLIATAPERLWLTVQGGLLGSTDAGHSWLDTHVIATTPFFLDPRHGWASDQQGTIYRTTDGEHWTRLRSQ
jgi:photosystem II stability/assembly factor-like uncharacterized protein